MDLLTHPYIVAIFFTAFLSALIAVYAYRRRLIPGAIFIPIQMLLVGVWAFFYALELAGGAGATLLTWKIQYIGVSFIPGVWFAFVLCYTGIDLLKKPVYLLVMAIEPTLILILAWTNEAHGLIWRDFQSVTIGDFTLLDKSYGPLAWIHIFYSYILVAFGMLLMLRHFFNSARFLRDRTVILLIGSLFPWFSNAVYIFHLSPFSSLDLTPLAFIVFGLTIIIGFDEIRFLDFGRSVSHPAIDRTEIQAALPSEKLIQLEGDRFRQMVENSPNPIFSTDRGGKINSWNRACETAFSYRKEILGESYHVVLLNPADHDSLDNLLRMVFEQKTSFSDIDISYCTHDGSPRYMVSRLFPLLDQRGAVDSCIFANTDITERKLAEQVLQRQLKESVLFSAIAAACVEITDEDALIEKATEIIGQRLPVKNYGLLLFDRSEGVLHFHPSYQGISKEIQGTAKFNLGQGIVGRVALTGLTRRVNDVKLDGDYISLGYPARSECCVPVKVGECLVGVLNTESEDLGAFSAADERLLTILAGHLATAIERIRIATAERNRVGELLAITRLGSEISSMLDRQQVLNSIVRNAAEISRVDASAIFELSSNGRFYLVATFGVGEDFVQAVNAHGVPMEGTVIGRAVGSRQPAQAPDVEEDPNYLARSFSEMENIRAILALPMLRADEIIGGIVLWHRLPRRFSVQEQVFLQALAQQSVIALDNARLFEAERERRRLAEALSETGTALAVTLDLDTLLERLLDQIIRLIPYDTASLMIIEGDKARVAFHRGFASFLGEKASLITNMKFDLRTTPNLAEIIASGAPLIIPDVTIYDGWLYRDGTTDVRSWIGVPVIGFQAQHEDLSDLQSPKREHVTAIFCLEKFAPNFYKDEHLEVMTLFTGQASLALQNALLFQQARQRASQLEALNAVISTGAAATDLDTLLRISLGRILQALKLDIGGIQILDHYVTQNMPSEIISSFRMLIQPAKISAPFLLCVPDWQIDPVDKNLLSVANLIRSLGLRASLAASILSEGAWVGGISLLSQVPHIWLPEEQALIEAICQQLGAVVHRLALMEETQRNLQEFTLLGKVIADTASESNLQAAITQVCAEIARFFASPHVVFAVLDSHQEIVELVAEHIAPGRSSALGIRVPGKGHFQLAGFLQQKLPLVIKDIHDVPYPEIFQRYFNPAETDSLVLVPVSTSGGMAGALGINITRQRKFTDADAVVMQNVSRQVGQALERLRLYQVATQHASQMARLAELSENLNQPLTPDEVLVGIGQGALDLCEASGVAIFQVDPAKKVVCSWHSALSEDLLDWLAGLGPGSQSPFWQAIKTVEPVFFMDRDWELVYQTTFAGYQENFCRGLAVWPLIFEGRAMALIVCSFDLPRDWTVDQQEVMLAFTRQAAVALQNALLFDETRRRSAQQEALNAIIAAAVTAPDLRKLLATALDLTMQAVQVKMGGIWVSNEYVFRGFPEDEISTGFLTSSQPGQKIDRTIVLNDLQNLDEEASPFPELVNQVAKYGGRASLSVPVSVEGRQIGAMSLASAKPRNWLAEEVALIETVGKQLGSAVERLTLLAITQEQAGQMQQIMDTVPEGVVLLDSEARILLANPAAWHHLACLADDVNSDRPLARLGGRSISALLTDYPDQLWQELEIGGPTNQTFEIAARSLERRGGEQGWVLVSREITQEREVQKRVQMQDRLATVGQLAAGIAHDFNNIMATITIYADLLSLEPNLAPTSLERLKIIQQQVQRANSLIRQILDFSRRAVMEQSELDLLPFIKELDKLLVRVLPENIRLNLVYQPGTYLVKADPTRLQQVFMNLALNARDAMPTGGKLHFELSRLQVQPDELLVLPGLTPGNWIRVTVGDTGMGIKPEALPHIFDPFFTTKPVGQGTGLGLAQVYGIIQQHGGCIDVSSRLGDGTTFYIYLKEEKKREANVQFRVELVDLKGEGREILVVEDDDATRDALKALLEAHRFKALTASNGLEALESYQQHRQEIRLVVSDIVMPEMGGLALYHALQEIDPELKILFITGHPLDDENQDLLEKGWIRWLQKPFSAQDFIRVINDLTVVD